ncbi:MAG TPA: tryptophan--tRNA ligase, partial [Streptosporangiaceae bacterium]|nr:tryptophan--tRNA ligase [Streptosporangiaceae bacterium]
MSAITATPSQLASQRRSDDLETAIDRDPSAFRILSGDRPTGPLHVGHYFGSLANRIRLQDAGVEVLVLIADYQAITDRTAPAELPGIVMGLMADYLAVGIDPSRATIFAHSQVAPLNQLLLPFLSLVSVAEIRRNPTVKDEIAATGSGTVTGLMFTYPVHQAADILFCHANLVPVGRDQLPHLELTRTIARRFNERYCQGAPYFPAPAGLLSAVPLLLGTDGQKMSKSRGNSVPIRATADETVRLLAAARTDSERFIGYDPKRRP